MLNSDWLKTKFLMPNSDWSLSSLLAKNNVILLVQPLVRATLISKNITALARISHVILKYDSYIYESYVMSHDKILLARTFSSQYHVSYSFCYTNFQLMTSSLWWVTLYESFKWHNLLWVIRWPVMTNHDSILINKTLNIIDTNL